MISNHIPDIDGSALSEEEEEARWDAIFEATVAHSRAMGEAARAAYEAGQTVEMDLDDEYLGLGKESEDR